MAQVRRYDYEMFATESGRSVFASADLDADGRIDLAGFSKIVHVRHPSLFTLTRSKNMRAHSAPPPPPNPRAAQHEQRTQRCCCAAESLPPLASRLTH